jgi:predicted nucleic acid-binding protein
LTAADSSSLISFLEGETTPDVSLVREGLRLDTLWLPPPVKTELMSRTVVGATFDDLVRGARLLPITPGFWERAGDNRRLVLSKGLRARLADTLIAQCCLDADAPLITRDSNFRHFARWCGLRLAV